MMSMVERVARAIMLDDYDGDDLWEETLQEVRDNYLCNARAALEEMRTPTDAMVDAGYAVFEEAYDPAHCYSMMIDAALNEQVAG